MLYIYITYITPAACKGLPMDHPSLLIGHQTGDPLEALGILICSFDESETHDLDRLFADASNQHPSDHHLRPLFRAPMASRIDLERQDAGADRLTSRKSGGLHLFKLTPAPCFWSVSSHPTEVPPWNSHTTTVPRWMTTSRPSCPRFWSPPGSGS